MLGPVRISPDTGPTSLAGQRPGIQRRPERIVHQSLARLAADWPALSAKLLTSLRPVTSTSIPWSPVKKPLTQSKIALVTTAGIHHKDQQPFDMLDALGDPTFRVIDAQTIANGYRITHDYCDHRDADRDLNIVFPIDRISEIIDLDWPWRHKSYPFQPWHFITKEFQVNATENSRVRLTVRS